MINENQRVLITGLSAVSACGLTAEETWAHLLAGESGIKPMTQWDIASWSHRLVGEIRDIKPATMLPDRKLAKAISRHDILGINAAMQAVQNSQLLPYRESLAQPELFNESTGVYVGSPGNKYYQQYDFLSLLAKTGNDMQAFGQQLFDEVHPMWLLRILPNNVLAYTGMTYGFKGANQNITNHAVGGMQAIIEAYHAIRAGLVERVVVVAYDIGTEPQALFYYNHLGVISARHLKPFDREHDGTILADGASALILESEQSARTRQAVCYGEVMGGASGSEIAGLYSIEAEGQALASLLTRTLIEHQVTPKEVGFVVAHGNGNKLSDQSEAHALEQVFGEFAVPVTGFKWAMGHTLCASGVLDTVLAVHALGEQCIPGIANLNACACEWLNACNATRSLAYPQAPVLLINRGFASMNACLLIRACEKTLA